MKDRRHLVVVGAGPAGVSAAVQASRAGMRVSLIDENRSAGGQYYRARQDADEAGSPRYLERGADIETILDTVVVDEPEPGVLTTYGAKDGIRAIRFDALVIATGAFDRTVPIPGWTLPGVVTAGAAHTLAKGHGVTPGRRVVVAGSGPFLLPVADVLARHGSRVRILEATPLAVSMRGIGTLLRDPDVLLQALGYTARLTWRRARRSYGRTVTAIHGEGRVEAVTIEMLDDDWVPVDGSAETIPADAVCLGFGFVPQLELAQLLGCDIGYLADSSDFHVAVDRSQRTSRRGVYAAGEVTGTAGVRVATSEGRLAGLTAAFDAGHISATTFTDLAERIEPRLARLRHVAEWIRRAYRPRPGLWALAQHDTIVCRCEDVPLAAVARAVESNLPSPIAAKAVTRAGMGLCQGRVCGPFLMEWLRSQRDFAVPGDAWPWSVRPPIRPVPLGDWVTALAVESD